MTYSILYVSSAVKDLKTTDIEEIMKIATYNNGRLDISGFLVYNKGNFLQLLEGEKEHVKTIYERVKKDPRHKNIIHILDQPTGIRSFEDYHSGFEVCDNPELVKELKNYISSIKTKQTFRLSNALNLADGILQAM